MPCRAKEAGGVYRPRHPQQTPFYQLVERFFPQFEAVYEERYQERDGFWRPIIGTVVRKFLECGDLKQGFARVRCPRCREEFFVPFSCRVRCFCPSCHEKRTRASTMRWAAFPSRATGNCWRVPPATSRCSTHSTSWPK